MYIGGKHCKRAWVLEESWKVENRDVGRWVYRDCFVNATLPVDTEWCSNWELLEMHTRAGICRDMQG